MSTIVPPLCSFMKVTDLVKMLNKSVDSMGGHATGTQRRQYMFWHSANFPSVVSDIMAGVISGLPCTKTDTMCQMKPFLRHTEPADTCADITPSNRTALWEF